MKTLNNRCDIVFVGMLIRNIMEMKHEDKLRELVLECRLLNIDKIYALFNPEMIGLQFREIAVIPSRISTLDLRIIKIEDSDISVIPEFVTKITTLERLEIDNTAVTTLPDMSGLANIRYLRISRSRLASISFDGMHSLEIIDLHDNQLTEFPDISKLDKLRIIYLQDNPMQLSELNLPANLERITLDMSIFNTDMMRYLDDVPRSIKLFFASKKSGFNTLYLQGR